MHRSLARASGSSHLSRKDVDEGTSFSSAHRVHKDTFWDTREEEEITTILPPELLNHIAYFLAPPKEYEAVDGETSGGEQGSEAEEETYEEDEEEGEPLEYEEEGTLVRLRGGISNDLNVLIDSSMDYQTILDLSLTSRRWRSALMVDGRQQQPPDWREEEEEEKESGRRLVGRRTRREEGRLSLLARARRRFWLKAQARLYHGLFEEDIEEVQRALEEGAEPARREAGAIFEHCYHILALSPSTCTCIYPFVTRHAKRMVSRETASTDFLPTLELLFQYTRDRHELANTAISAAADDDFHGLTILTQCAIGGGWDEIELLLDHGADPLSTAPNMGMNAINAARQFGHLEIADKIQERVKRQRRNSRRGLRRRSSSSSSSLSNTSWSSTLRDVQVDGSSRSRSSTASSIVSLSGISSDDFEEEEGENERINIMVDAEEEEEEEGGVNLRSISPEGHTRQQQQRQDRRGATRDGGRRPDDDENEDDINVVPQLEEEGEEPIMPFDTAEDVAEWVERNRPMFVKRAHVRILQQRMRDEEITPDRLFQLATAGWGRRGDPEELERLFHLDSTVAYSLQMQVPPHLVWRNLIIAKMKELGR